MKYAITNPPYNKTTHLEFVNLCTEASDKVVAVHPANTLLNKRPTPRQECEHRFNKNLDDYKSSVHLFNGNGIFDAGFFTPLSITTIEKTNSVGVEVTGLYESRLSTKDINVIGEFANKFYNLQFELSLSDVANTTSGKFIVDISGIRGNVVRDKTFHDDFFTFVPRTKTVVVELSSKRKNPSVFRFETLEEATNFLNYLKTKFSRFMLALYKTGVHISSVELKAVPWMDFTQSWDDEKLFRHFNVSKEDQQLINNFISNYYELLDNKPTVQ